MDIAYTTVDRSRFLHYIKETCQGEEVLANIYSKVVWVLENMKKSGRIQRRLYGTPLKGRKCWLKMVFCFICPNFWNGF